MTDAPHTHAVADALGVDAGRLRSFLREHPDPEAEHLLAWADVDADEELADALERAIADVTAERERDASSPVFDIIRKTTDGGDARPLSKVVGAAADLEPGAVVVDREDPPRERDEAIVVNTPPVPADEWEVLGDQTVAEYDGNEPYPVDDPVACVVYREAFDRTDRDPDDVDGPIPLRDLDVNYYTFPVSRLRVVEDREGTAWRAHGDAAEDGGGGGEPSGDAEEDPAPRSREAQDTLADAPADLAAIARALRERNVDDVTVDQDAGLVRVEKLGLAYTIKRDGTVLDGGAFADALEAVATGALDDTEDEDEDEDEEVVA